MHNRNNRELQLLRNGIRLLITVITGYGLGITAVNAQNNISLLRYDDNFTNLKYEKQKTGFDRLKFIALGRKSYLSVGGESREQVQFFKNANFGDAPPPYKNETNWQLNHRLMVHAAVDLGEKVSLFLQLNNTLRFFNPNPAVPEIDENQLSLHQAFAELKLRRWKFRMGRQELLYGNHRVVTVREGPNTRKTFDGIVLKKSFQSGSIDIFCTTPVIAGKYIFDDQSGKESFAGIYGTQFFAHHKIGLDYYILNLQSRLRKYNYKIGYENRQTFGLRLFSKLPNLNIELEGAYQTGRFGDETIRAYNLLADINILLLPDTKGLLGFMANSASGDRNSEDKKLNTYNLLFARPAYGLAVPFGASNMISLSPYLKINPLQKLSLLAQVFFLRRNSNQDGTYSPGMIENRPRKDILFRSGEKTIGVLYLLESNYQHSKRLELSLDATYLKAGAYPKATGNGRDIFYLACKYAFRF